MTRIIIDPNAEGQFRSLTERVEVCDGTGRTLGLFTPAIEPVTVPFTEEELDRFEQEPGGRPLSEILAGLENRP